MATIIHPTYYLVVRRDASTWYFQVGEPFYNPTPIAYPSKIPTICEAYHTTKVKVAVELFRLQAGKTGYYLANVRDKKYYYCGLEFDDVKVTLQSLGIGRDAP